ncbi:hypothetical protein F5882DRAFT_475768 [Hyaloscypha sp. PMI_1271]|nr:hypothetical protein F5882DRAFT_475768 [Hyaloscypha sp. PMI_1271]
MGRTDGVVECMGSIWLNERPPGNIARSQARQSGSKADPKLDPAPRIVIGRGASEEGEMYCTSRGSSHVWTVVLGWCVELMVMGEDSGARVSEHQRRIRSRERGHAIGRRGRRTPLLRLPSAHPRTFAASCSFFGDLYRSPGTSNTTASHSLEGFDATTRVPAPNYAATGVAQPLDHTDLTPSPLDAPTKRLVEEAEAVSGTPGAASGRTDVALRWGAGSATVIQYVRTP